MLPYLTGRVGAALSITTVLAIRLHSAFVDIAQA